VPARPLAKDEWIPLRMGWSETLSIAQLPGGEAVVLDGTELQPSYVLQLFSGGYWHDARVVVDDGGRMVLEVAPSWPGRIRCLRVDRGGFGLARWKQRPSRPGFST